MRVTETNLEPTSERRIEDYWCSEQADGLDPARNLSAPWTGKTMFEIRYPMLKGNVQYSAGRPTRMQRTTRPGHVRKEVWDWIGESAKKTLREEWKHIGPERDKIRTLRQIPKKIPLDEVPKYEAVLTEAKEKLRREHPDQPIPKFGIFKAIDNNPDELEDADDSSGPTAHEHSSGQTATNSSGQTASCGTQGTNLLMRSTSPSSQNTRSKSHHEKLPTIGYVSPAYFNLIHKPIEIPEAMKIPGARKALDKEWDKLHAKAWGLNSVQEKSDIEEWSKRTGQEVHFANILELVHEKHAELNKVEKEYKGRCVLGGHNVRDASGYLGVFSEQGTSASLMPTAKMIDALARCPEMEGYEMDAQSAYTQADLGGPPTYIILPRHRWPKEWHGKYDKPCVKYLKALYDHPNAGLYWERRCAAALIKQGFEKSTRLGMLIYSQRNWNSHVYIRG